MKKPVRARQSGYAVLFIFVTVAIVGIMFYSALPRVVFEAQRDQEQLLVDRGEQYKRAIQLYYRKFRKYPTKIDDLENTNGQRFLRQRYKDPMTGKDEWRAIHIGPNGQFIDSLTQKAKKQDTTSVNNFITELKPIGDASTGLAAPVNLGLRKRPSDPGGANNADPNDLLGSDAVNNDLGLIQTPDGNANGNTNGTTPGIPGGLAAGDPSANGFNTNNNPNNLNGFNNNNGNGNSSNNSANNGQNPSGADMMRNLLTSPRPGGPPPGIFPNSNNNNSIGGSNDTSGLPQSQNATNVMGNSSGSAFGSTPGTSPGTTGSPLTGSVVGGPNVGGQTLGGGGIAGFASKAERTGIKIYNEKHKYNEWEFIYDYAKDKSMGGGQTIPVQNSNPTGANPARSTDPSNPGTSATPTTLNSTDPNSGATSPSQASGGSTSP